MLKLQDFAQECRVTDRQIQRLIRKYEGELQDHYERRGQNGTWLDETACNILRSKMKINSVVVADNELQKKIEELEARIERKDVIIERMQERETEKDNLIDQLRSEQLRIEEKSAEREKEVKDQAADQIKRIEEIWKDHAKAQKEIFDERVGELEKQLEAERNKSWLDRLLRR